MLERVGILGSTGSIGSSTLDVIELNRDLYSVELLTANTNYQKLFTQCQKFNPELVVMVCEESASKLRDLLANAALSIKVESGIESLNQAANLDGLDIVVASIVGAAGLLPTMTSVKNGHKVLLANKEALVMSGELFMNQVKNSGATLLPVDSEHNAIFQCLSSASVKAKPILSGVSKILLTGSGGPFLREPLNVLRDKTPAEACAHPNWDMGQKISVDSATMMNKGLELIEACFLFSVSVEQIDIVVHPQSIIHSMVSYVDGSVISQMGRPDMKTPIAHCLAWPKRIEAGVEQLDFFKLNHLTFTKPDFERFPCLALAIEAIKIGKSAPCIMNAANEMAVEAFLSNKIRFDQIAVVIKKVLANSEFKILKDIATVLTADELARAKALTIIEELG